MNFFEEQEKAKKLTRWLVFWYLVILTVVSVLSTFVLMLLVPLFIHEQANGMASIYHFDNWPVFIAVSGFVFIGAFVSSYLKSRELSSGGSAVAEILGGTLVSTNTQNRFERRALNIVQEMAIAANLPAPPLYLLKEETNINAFAAGFDSSDAIIAITRGTLERLDRDQLQGVIAHEFSHILNGDMRLNLRLIMLLQGIEFVGVLGRFFTATRRTNRVRRGSKKGGGLIVLVGILLRMIGWIAEFFAKILQAAISRQREFLADASAVQFTRNPEGIAGALKVLAHPVVHHQSAEQKGSHLKSQNSEIYAHLFFAQGVLSKLDWFATHPSLKERILKIDPKWDGSTLKGFDLKEPRVSDKTVEGKTMPAGNESFNPVLGANPEFAWGQLGLLAGVFGAQWLQSFQVKRSATDTVTETNYRKLIQILQEPLDSVALVVVLILQKQRQSTEFVARLQTIDWHEAQFPGIESNLINIETLLSKLPKVNALSLIEVAMPTLKQLSAEQKGVFLEVLEQAVRLDKEVSVYETALIEILERHLAEKKRSDDSIFNTFKPVDLELRLVLEFMIGQFVGSEQRQDFYDKVCLQLGISQQTFRLDETVNDLMIQSALKKIRRLNDRLKDQFISELVSMVEGDQQLDKNEEEVVLAIAVSIEAHIPRFQLQVD